MWIQYNHLNLYVCLDCAEPFATRQEVSFCPCCGNENIRDMKQTVEGKISVELEGIA